MFKQLAILKAEDLQEGTLGKRLYSAFITKGISLEWFCRYAGISGRRLISILKAEKEINLQEIRYAVIALQLSADEARSIFFPPDPAADYYQKGRITA